MYTQIKSIQAMQQTRHIVIINLILNDFLKHMQSSPKKQNYNL